MSTLSEKAENLLRHIADSDVRCKAVNAPLALHIQSLGFITVVRKKDAASLSGKTRYYRITEKGLAELEDVKS